jgi:transcriptional regulator with XRE-family HTH domain
MQVTEPRSALRAARSARGWSQAEAARALAALARAQGVSVAAPASLKTQLSRWENGHAAPDAPYPALLGELYGRSGVELGLDAGQAPGAPDPAARVKAHVATAAAVDADVIALWRDQLGAARGLDHRLGGAGAAETVRTLVAQLDEVLRHLPDPPRRRAVAALLSAAAALAGLQALDMGDPDAAVARYARAAEAARDARAAALAAAAAVGHALVLVEVGEPLAALAVLEYAGPGPPGRARLQAAVAVARAAAGDAAGARRALDAAERAHAEVRASNEPALPARALAPPRSAAHGSATSADGPPSPRDVDHRGPAAPDVVHASAAFAVELGSDAPVDLPGWRGRALAALGDAAAVEHLLAALDGGPRSVRDRAELHALLAGALAMAGRAADAANHARQAQVLAARIGSERIPRWLAAHPPPADACTVPHSSSAAR